MEDKNGMRGNDTCRCRYAHCIHQGDPLLKSKAVKVGSTFYHPECYKEMETIKEIIDYFAKHINRDVVFSQLQKVIDNICFPKKIDGAKIGVSPERLLFQLKYCVMEGWNIKYPGALYYVVQNREAHDAYIRATAGKIKQIMKDNQTQEESKPEDLNEEKTYHFRKQKSFEDILIA